MRQIFPNCVLVFTCVLQFEEQENKRCKAEILKLNLRHEEELKELLARAESSIEELKSLQVKRACVCCGEKKYQMNQQVQVTHKLWTGY